MLFIGLDDTDNLQSRGTGHLARQIAAALAADYAVLGVTRHQLLVDPRVPCTKNNSCAAITLEDGHSGGNGRDDGRSHGDPAALAEATAAVLLERVSTLMLADFQPGSDPGLCVAYTIPPAVAEFGRRTQRQLVSQAEARALAAEHGIALRGLGGDEDGVIGALAAVGLAASGQDGRYVLVGRSRELSGLQPVAALLAAGIVAVQTADGQPVTDGLVQTDKLRPARRDSRPIAVVEWTGEHWLPLKLD
jgi:tRNA(Ile2) C34 agmatinyltransferase TiaS